VIHPTKFKAVGVGGKRLTGAALDRRTQRCHILETKGERYRLRDAKPRRHDGPGK